ncbi:MAG: GNAT family N-acetyltransferase [Candidatus Bathyarchaeota archaeon]|jgi:RimJ/RimL family protein N-acetyltransferase
MNDEPFWMKPKIVELSDGTEVTLRPEVESDLELTWEMFCSFSDATLEYLPIPITRERVEGWFKNIDYSKALPILGFVEAENGTKMITSASLSFQQQEVFKHRATFGISIRDDYQNKGLGKILTQYMLDIAKERGMKKVELTVVTQNERAIHVYEKMGFEKEGLDPIGALEPHTRRVW